MGWDLWYIPNISACALYIHNLILDKGKVGIFSSLQLNAKQNENVRTNEHAKNIQRDMAKLFE